MLSVEVCGVSRSVQNCVAHDTSVGTCNYQDRLDLVAMIYKAAVGSTASGPLAQNASQADIDAEQAKWRSGVGKRRALPQLTLSFCYIPAMRPAASYFTYFWFSHRLAAGEANA